MSAIYHLDLQGFLLAIDKQIAQLPHPLSEVIEPGWVFTKAMPLVIGYEDRRDLVETELGKALYSYQMIPYAIESFIQEIIKCIDDHLMYSARLRIHYSTHTYEIGQWLIIHETAMVKPTTKYVSPVEQTEYHRRVMREEELQREREEAYASEYGRYGQSSHWAR